MSVRCVTHIIQYIHLTYPNMNPDRFAWLHRDPRPNDNHQLHDRKT